MASDRPSGGNRSSGSQRGGSKGGTGQGRSSQGKSSGGSTSTGGKSYGGSSYSSKSSKSGKPGSGGKSYSSKSGKPGSGGKSYSSKSGKAGKPGSGEKSYAGKASGSRDSRGPRDAQVAAPAVSNFDEELIGLARTERVLPGDVKADLEVFHPRVADLLGAAYLLVEDDPDEALRYALEAKRHASRSPVVREACGMAAYYAGDFEVAIKELRTVRRLTGRDDMVPLIADCERALGNPQKAIDMASEPLRLSEDNQIELRIVAAGARMDLGQPEAAALLLRVPLLESAVASSSSARLKYAYAEAMLAAGETSQARDWFGRAAKADVEGDLDAHERLEALAG